MYKKAYIFGIGMIGGSIAHSLKDNKISKNIFAYDTNNKSLIFAKKNKIINDYDDSSFKYLKQADLIIICTPISAYKKIFEIIKIHKNRDCIITDVGSTKVSVIKDIIKVFGEEQKYFTGSHPLAGREKSGIRYAQPDLFLNATVIITPTRKTNILCQNKIKRFWRKLGCKVEILTPLLHDIIMSETSHVPHLVSYSLVNSIFKNRNIKKIHNFTGGGFKDFSRIACSDPVMWRDICKYNKRNIISSLDSFINDLKSLKIRLTKNDFGTLYSLFKKTKKRLSQ